MRTTDIPVMFIKKPNGGVHTARNAAKREARGKFIVGVDSDDELMPDACRIFINAWESISDDTKHLYRGVQTLCVDEKGKLVGKTYPENANLMRREDFLKSQKGHGERHNCVRADISKANLMPEPDGVKFVGEGIFWEKIEREYLIWSINEVTRIYHTEGLDHFVHKPKNLQWCKNNLWMTMHMLNNPASYYNGFIWYVKGIMRHSVLSSIISRFDKDFVKHYPLRGLKNRLWSKILYLPSCLALPFYRLKHHMTSIMQLIP